ncbi:MAG: hypothetical protein JXD22_17375 [Sedimentisphaerales bacterium]|nr:hypothetical protein [Sedimentisphaerales bacterium]
MSYRIYKSKKYTALAAHRAFTILELLCVIIIVVFLLALLLPSLNSARSRATFVVCQSYLRAYGLSGHYYLNENNDFFPDGPDEWLYSKASISPDHPMGYRWHDQAMAINGEIMNSTPEFRGKMWSYFEGTRLGPCPTFRRFAESRGCQNPQHNNNLDIYPQFSYSINGYLGSNIKGAILRSSQARDPKSVFFFSEENSWTIQSYSSYLSRSGSRAPLSTTALDDNVLLITPTPEADGCFATYHGSSARNINTGSANVVFLDGHIDSIEFEDQLRKNMHNGNSRLGPAGNLTWAWVNNDPPPGGWDAQ